jgi:Flp pilus assembly protein TadD
MPVTDSVTRFCRLAITSLLLVCSACQVPEQASDNRYQRAIETTVSAQESRSPAVIQLQNQALAAINEDQYQLAIDFLQRAIKIQPRDAWSWHYLADIDWRRGEYEHCRAMIERSSGYAPNDVQLGEANAALLAQCQ